MKILRIDLTPANITRIAMLAAVLIVVNLSTAYLSFNIGPLNLRLGDSLLLLTYYSGPWAVWAFAVAGTVSNLLGSTLGWVDVIFGGLIMSVVGGLLALRATSPIRAALSWALVTGFGVGSMLLVLFRLPLLPTALPIVASNLIMLLVVGIPLCRALVSRINMPRWKD